MRALSLSLKVKDAERQAVLRSCLERWVAAEHNGEPLGASLPGTSSEPMAEDSCSLLEECLLERLEHQEADRAKSEELLLLAHTYFKAADEQTASHKH